MPDGQPGVTLTPVKTTDVYRTDAAAGGAEQKYHPPGRRSGAGRRQLGGVLRNRRYRRQYPRPQPVAGHAADHPVCAGDGGLDFAFRRAGAKGGRKAAFMAGTGAGVVTGLAAALAVVLGSFLLFCFAAMLGGAYAAVALSFRFAATTASLRNVAPARCRW